MRACRRQALSARCQAQRGSDREWRPPGAEVPPGAIGQVQSGGGMRTRCACAWQTRFGDMVGTG
jgi:hypothetical protein